MADIVCFMVEAGDSRIGKADGIILDLLERIRVPVVLVVNKTDAQDPFGVGDGWKCFTEKKEFARVLLISALEGRNLDLLLEVLFSLLLPGPPIFDDERLVDCTERFIAAEVIREKVLEYTEQEVPHSVAVVVEEFKSPDEYPERRNLLVRATLFVERTGQKAILIGKNGAKLKRIGEHARKELEEVFGYDVYLDLWVKVRPGWRNSEKELRRMGYT
jgi:GTP-binding protein Era